MGCKSTNFIWFQQTFLEKYGIFMLNSCAKLLQLLYVCANFVTLQPRLLINIINKIFFASWNNRNATVISTTSTAST